MSGARTFRPLADVPVAIDQGAVYEHGWQSWSPTTVHSVTGGAGPGAHGVSRWP